MKDLVLCIGIGNTNTRFAVFNQSREIIARETFGTRELEKFLKHWKKQKKLKSITTSRIVTSVNKILIVSTQPSADQLVKLWCKAVFGLKPLRAGADLPIPMPVLVARPEKVGRDRLLNTFAAYQKTKRLCLVIDFGTAITFDVVSERGEFLGGVIAAGLTTSARALHQDCELLPLIKPAPTDHVIGKHTEEALQSGVFLGTVGLTKYLIDKITAEIGKKPDIIATGGDAEILRSYLPEIDEIIPDLTLKGLIYLADVPPTGKRATGRRGL